jgi:hypothetical protein
VDRDIEITGLILGTVTRRRQHYAFSSDASLSEKTSVNASYSYDNEKFNQPGYTESTAQDVSLQMSHNLDALVPQTIGRVSLGYTLYDYPGNNITDQSITDSSFMVGASKRISETLELSADIGRQLARSRLEIFHFIERSKTRGGIGQMALTYHEELSTTSLSYLQDVRSISGEVGLTRYSSLRFNTSRRFTYELRGEFVAEYYLNKQNGKKISGNAIDEKTFRLQPRLVYSFTNDLSLETSYRLIRLKDNEYDQRKIQNLFFLNVTWQYPIPL